MKLQSVVPILYCSDIQKSFSYYTEQLGFTKNWDWGNPVDFGAVGKDGVEFFLHQIQEVPRGMSMAINVDNVDEYYEMIRERGASILAAPEDKEWNMREMVVADPDRNILRIGHRTDCE
jgi:catechol 2,3-dioxygenase-like lactoylglutathione lyase family enzyme